MFEYVEVHKQDPGFAWIEIIGADSANQGTATIRLVVDEGPRMVRGYIERYLAKRENSFQVPKAQHHQLEEMFEEACMAKAFVISNSEDTSEVPQLYPTTVIHFKYPERTSFRKSRSARVALFRDDALTFLRARNFEAAMHRLNWIHLLVPANNNAFELKVVCLRSWKKMAECVPVFETWIQHHPEKIEPRLGLSEMWLYLGQNQKARETFEQILSLDSHNVMALVGLAQARCRLGEDPIIELRKAWVQDPNFTVEMIENQFDFRGTNTPDLEQRSLADIASEYKIPLKRLLERARKGVLPMHPLEGSNELLRFSRRELDRHYQVLKSVGLEINSAALSREEDKPEAVQPSLFDD